LVRCQSSVKEDVMVVSRMEDPMQEIKGGGDDEMVVFFGVEDQGAIADHKYVSS
jgi:hypothetical protein